VAYTRGDVVLVPFPFTNQAGVKARPAIVVSDSKFNSRDVVLVAITSQPPTTPDPLRVDLPPNTSQFAATGLRSHSAVLVGKLMCIEQSLIYRVIGRADQMLMTEVDQRLRLLFAM
jgi:mRNA interferase MazF